MRLKILKSVIFLLFLVLFANIFWMQIVNGPEYEKRSRNNRIRLVPEDASRGIIYDRNKIPLVENKIAFDIVAIPQEIDKEINDKVFSRLAEFLNISSVVLADTFLINFNSSFSPVMLVSDVSKDTAFLIEQAMSELPGIFIKTRVKRNYIYSGVTASLIGYIGKMRESEYPELKKYGYRIRDVIGRTGLTSFQSSC